MGNLTVHSQSYDVPSLSQLMDSAPLNTARVGFYGSGFGVQASEFRVEGAELRVEG